MENYLSHINIKEFGKIGQEKISKAHIALIGLGGLGSPIIQYLAAAGIGEITIIDDDIIESSNLSRQVIYNINDIDKAKIDVAEQLIKRINPKVIINKFYKRLNQNNIDLLLNKASIIIDASDNFKTKFLLNKYSHHNIKIFISGSATKMQGYLSVYDSGNNHLSPCFECFHHGEHLNLSEKSCANNGILGPVVGVIGSLMAVEIMKAITMKENLIIGKMLYYNALNNRFKTINIEKRIDCFCNK